MHRALLRPFSTMPHTVLRIALRGNDILQDPRFNKGTAFPLDERKDFGLTGRLPYRVNSLDEQCQRAYDQLQSRDSAIRKNSFLQSMKEQNLVLYYALLQRHLRELIPIIYTPTEVCPFTTIQRLYR
jgi:malate dehydrogenase (oxaloacetate-decarboxylating)